VPAAGFPRCDPALRAPNPSLGPLDRLPHGAIEVLPGGFGTFAGPSADASARTLDGDDVRLPGGTARRGRLIHPAEGSWT
jgi:hypothetical protein